MEVKTKILTMIQPNQHIIPILNDFALRNPKFYVPLSAAVSMAATILAIKIYESYNPTPMSHFKLKMMKFQRDYPAAPVVALIFFAAMGFLSLSVGIGAGIAFGIYAGCRFELDHTLRLQEMPMYNDSNEKPLKEIVLR